MLVMPTSSLIIALGLPPLGGRSIGAEVNRKLVNVSKKSKSFFMNSSLMFK
jgi:hypothetical protein